MSLILNSGLPAGSRGLWWFAQGLSNLGTAATGAATLNSSALTGGQVVHDNVNDTTDLAVSDSTLLIPTAAITVILKYAKTDSTLRASCAFGIKPFETDAQRCSAHAPYSDDTIYWDFGGVTSGTTRLSTSGTGLFSGAHIWAYTIGARGMEIWRDGTKIASNAATPTRTAVNTKGFALGIGGGGTLSDLVAYDWVFIHETQLSETLIADIAADPAGELTETAPDFRAAWASRANVLIGGGVA